ncbi:hypothetical protein G3I59_05010 [Amycolatopsis rubida]|uniref:Uncharacterized protein n=1 Tax=Amycolatopsis rubida TaxID=112413 RepID=A0A1I6BDZ4_9PSEU|nr:MULTISPECIES: hypothetical protein [Amycolatopsis]MYW89995.1 hypothetical protein [Amycolatopsis rubida]NEC54972.1 hypothetical protein [Amycolatopsis rubida]OAP29171.1 hypothetical protein A4R44_00966 [Amycolatopsis sp. M39]SFQ79185.1 hypothetical protein SAMN05421854_1267 [Amycolatopsis rubida]
MSRKEKPITASVSTPLFSHPVAEPPRPGALVLPQDDRYDGLFRQPAGPSGERKEPQPRAIRPRHRRR